jgi:hypothetical protein
MAIHPDPSLTALQKSGQFLLGNPAMNVDSIGMSRGSGPGSEGLKATFMKTGDRASDAADLQLSSMLQSEFQAPDQGVVVQPGVERPHQCDCDPPARGGELGLEWEVKADG